MSSPSEFCEAREKHAIEVTSLDKLSNDFESLCLSETCADVHFLVENERVPGHKAILYSRSEYFRSMLQGNEIVVPRFSATVFKQLLGYIYSGKLSFSSVEAFELLEIANQFGEMNIVEAITSYLQKNLTLENLADAFNAACFYYNKHLHDKCYHYVRENIGRILEGQTFKSFSKAAMDQILKEPVYAPDNILYNAILGWSESQDDTSEELISTYLEYQCLNPENKGIYLDMGAEKEVNYFKMKLKSEHLQETLLYSVECSLDRRNWTRIIDSREYSVNVESFCFPQQKIRYINLIAEEDHFAIHSFGLYFLPKIPIFKKNIIHPSKNVAIAEMGASSYKVELFQGNKSKYGGLHGFAGHDIPNDEFLSIRLGQPYLIDSCRLLLWDHTGRYYHYYVDCSLDNKHWTRIVDRTKLKSRSWQNFVFDPTPMMYIKIAGTYNSENRWFHCVHFECPSQDKKNAVRP